MEIIKSPLFLEGWSEFNKYKWGLNPKKERAYSGDNKDSYIDYLIYLDRNEKIRMPKLNNYLPMVFSTSPTIFKTPKLTNHWLYAAEEVVKTITNYGIGNGICFTPNIFDVRMFQWYGYIIEPRYTYIIDFPHDKSQMTHDVRRRINKCEKNNFRFEKTNNLKDIYQCLIAPSQRKTINFFLTLDDLYVAQQLIGEEYFRPYITYTPNGEPAAAYLVLHYPGCEAFAWLAGTALDQLTSGATQFNIQNVFEDLQNSGATGLDMTGALTPEVSRYKNDFGGRLVPYYMIMSPGLWSVGYQMYKKIFSVKKVNESSFMTRFTEKMKATIDRTVVKKVI